LGMASLTASQDSERITQRSKQFTARIVLYLQQEQTGQA